MNSEQIKLLRNINSKDDGTGKRIAGSLNVIFNAEVSYVDSRDYVIYDDANELIHIIRPNMENPVSQAQFPFRITTGFYDNVHYMEALYSMGNLEKAIDALMLDTGLIDRAKKDHIMKWAVGIQNHTIVPKQPGPYFKDTVRPIGRPPVCEIRDDGLHHATPNHMYSNVDRIHKIIRPAIDNSGLNLFRLHKDHYKIEVELGQQNSILEEIKNIIATFPEQDLYMASFTDNHRAVIYNPKFQETITNFVTNGEKVVEPLDNRGWNGYEKRLVLYIEAYDVRAMYRFDLVVNGRNIVDIEAKDQEVKSKINSAIDSFSYSVDNTVTRKNTAIEVTIEDPNIDADIDQFINMLPNFYTDVDSIIYTLGDIKVTADIDDVDSLNNFKQKIIESIPTVHGLYKLGNVNIVTTYDSNIIYTLKIESVSIEEQVDKILAGLNYEDNLSVSEVSNNVYDIITDNASLGSMLNDIAAIKGLESIVINDSNVGLTYIAGDDIESFKNSVNALLPDSNISNNIKLTMTVTG